MRLNRLNELQFKEVGDPEIATRIAAFEMAYRMQSSAPELMDISKEPAAIHEMYGTEPGQAFVREQLPAGAPAGGTGRSLCAALPSRLGQSWQQSQRRHRPQAAGDVQADRPRCCRAAAGPETTRPAGQHLGGMGRRVRSHADERRAQRSKFLGRDHHPRAFTVWLAGAGIKKGITLGATDELGYNVVEDKVHVHDLQATILHLLGLDHTTLDVQVPGPKFPTHRCERRGCKEAAGVNPTK